MSNPFVDIEMFMEDHSNTDARKVIAALIQALTEDMQWFAWHADNVSISRLEELLEHTRKVKNEQK